MVVVDESGRGSVENKLMARVVRMLTQGIISLISRAVY